MTHEQTISDEIDHHIRELKQKINILLELEKEMTNNVDTLQESNKQLKQKLHSQSRNSKELEQEKLILKEMKNLDANTSNELEVTKQNLNTIISDKNKMDKELEQQKILMNDIHQTMENKISKLEESTSGLIERLRQKSLSSKETEQEKIFLDEVSKNEISKTQAISKKYYLVIALTGIALAGIFVPYSLYVVTLVGEEYRVQDPDSVKSGYVIQNLKGDTIDTWLSWRLVDGDIMHVNIVDGNKFPEKVEIIKNAILSTEVIEIDDSLLHKGPKGYTSPYYFGWAGALEASSENPTRFFVPTKFEVSESTDGAGDITIRLVSTRNGDGYSGWTQSIADETQNQILKSEITIFDIDKISNNQLETITRHEFGHALGLAHSSAPEDLMAPTITTEFPYISECDVDAITLLYDGGKSSQVVCET